MVLEVSRLETLFIAGLLSTISHNCKGITIGMLEKMGCVSKFIRNPSE
jgi:hypothetical protein